jgi:hypothetical protein
MGLARPTSGEKSTASSSTNYFSTHHCTLITAPYVYFIKSSETKRTVPAPPDTATLKRQIARFLQEQERRIRLTNAQSEIYHVTK